MAEPKVDYNFLGRSGMKVSNLALGTMTFGKDEKSLVCNVHVVINFISIVECINTSIINSYRNKYQLYERTL